MKHYFKEFRLERTHQVPEKYLINELDFNIEKWNIFYFKFWELIVLYEIIKSNFYKRSISLEIPQEELGYHRGLELTTGNEGFNLGGDIITEKLLKCVNLYFKWDNLFSFDIPFDQIYGGSFNLFRQFNMFHINLSDELKYFAGSYFLIAHEISHAFLFNPEWDIVYEIKKGSIDILWYYLLFQDVEEVIEDFKSCSECPKINYEYSDKCPMSKIFHDCEYVFTECLVDLFASKISGFYYLIAFIDTLPFYDYINYIRVSLVHKVLLREGDLKDEEISLINRKYDLFSDLFKDDKRIQCLQCFNDLVLRWIEYIDSFNKVFLKDFISNSFLPDSTNDLSDFHIFFPSLLDFTS